MKQGNRLRGWIGLMVAWMWLAACQSPGLSGLEDVGVACSHRLEFQVFSQTRGAGGFSYQWNTDEFNIRRLYIYAFDDVHTRPDFFQDVFINSGQGVVKNYKVKMNINGVGKKRFYLIANPPHYIQKKLTLDCSEVLLKTMSVALQHPLNDIRKLPQEADGISNPEDCGFPMSSQFTAYVKEGTMKGELFLTATENQTDAPIVKIPIFRSLGKVSVTIQKKETQQEGVFVKSLRLFNYTCNGDLMPQWEQELTWVPQEGGWSKLVRLDLQKMKEHETKVGVEPISLIPNDVWVDTVEPSTLASFYLCQNSYGKQMVGDVQPGVDDVLGNRTTKLSIVLSDGRESVVDFPYLRRNDHLQVRIVIAKNIIQTTFMPWKLSEVTPDWEEEVKPLPGVTQK